MGTQRVAASLMTLLLASSAVAAEYHLETTPRNIRSEVNQQARAASQAGQKGKVVRRFVPGAGWTWFFRLGDFDGEDPARDAARELAELLGEPVVVYVTDDGITQELDRTLPTSEPPRPQVTTAKTRTAPEPPPGSAAEVLARSGRAHGGSGGAIAALRSSDGVVFQFRRTLPDGTVVDHVWGRHGERRCVEVIPVEGEVRASRMVLDGNSAWLAVDGGPAEPVDAQRAADTIGPLTPDRVVPFVFNFADVLENRRELEELELVGRSRLEDRPVYELGYDGDQNTGPLALRIDADTFHVLEVSMEQGELVHRFDGWSTTDGVAVPSRVRTWRQGELSDTVEIRALRAERPSEALCGAPE